jgi:hypothetical protein
MEKAAAFGEIEQRVVNHAAQGEMLALRIASEPNLGHAAAVDQFFEVKTAKPPGLGGRFLASLGIPKRHNIGGTMPQDRQITCENVALGKSGMQLLVSIAYSPDHPSQIHALVVY